MNPQEIFERLERPDVAVERLLDECRSPDLGIWEDHPELYLKFVERLIDQGHPGRALDLAREGQTHLKNNLQLQYQLALAAARGGNPRYAESLLEPLLTLTQNTNNPPPADLTVKLQVNVIALKGRVLKDRSTREPELARESATWYEQAAAVPGAGELSYAATFPLINAATMWRVAGVPERSGQIAAEVVKRIEPLAGREADAGNLWPAATFGEALLLLGRHTESLRWYLRAVEVAKSRGDLGSLTSIRNNLHRLQQVGATADSDFLDEHLGTVVLFSGHMIDSPDRQQTGKPPRFPNHPELIAAVANAIRKQLDEMNAKVGYCSLACGGDILFAEAMLDRDAELHVVLPFAQHDFLRTSVDFGQSGAGWRDWRMRFDRIIQRLGDISKTRLRYSTSEPWLGSDELFGFTNCMLQGLAVLRGRARASAPHAVILVDRSLPGEDDGTQGFLKSWSDAGFSSREIDLAALRIAHPAPKAARESVAAPAQTSSLNRPVKAMLFADVAGFSRIPEWQLSDFLTSYGDYLRTLFASEIGTPAIYANTWGDGLYVVFNNVADAGRFAGELIEPNLIAPPEWSQFGLGDITPFRVGLHAGPVFELENLFQGRSEFAGQHVNRAARIEPVTLLGCAYASEPFAAHLMMEAGDRFVIETVGVHSLAKDYDRCPLYRLQTS